MNATAMQKALAAKGFDPGAPDGVAGARTYAALFNYMAGRDLGLKALEYGAAAAHEFPLAQINTPLRLAHFMAQASAETGAFRFTREIWGPTDAQVKYEGRADLGNCVPGDGQKFMGRGVFQCTGRDNYHRYGQRLGLDLCCNPHLVEQPEVSIALACLYWSDHRLNEWADHDDILATSNGINRGNPASKREPNGFDARKKALERAKAVCLA